MTLCYSLRDIYAVERNATEVGSRGPENHRGTFFPVYDSRKRKIRGLWTRNERFYAQMRVDRGDGSTRPVRIPLEATTLDAARKEAEDKRAENRKKTLHLPGYRPKFEALAQDYMASAEFQGKKEGTRQNEEQALSRWTGHLGHLRIDWIRTSQLVDFRNKRIESGVTARTVNLDMVAFNNAMSYAELKGWLSKRPKVRKLEEKSPPKRPLLSPKQIGGLPGKCKVPITRNGKLLKNYLRFLYMSGAREQESLQTQKTDVGPNCATVTIGSEGDTKNRKYRTIDCSPELQKLLKEILKELPPDTSFLFPSPQRGNKDVPAKSLRESFKLVREAAGLPWVGFHDFRHYFCSTCVMAGIDFMTIAYWVGQKDGGILIGKVYGHLADEHKKRATAKLSFS